MYDDHKAPTWWETKTEANFPAWRRAVATVTQIVGGDFIGIEPVQVRSSEERVHTTGG